MSNFTLAVVHFSTEFVHSDTKYPSGPDQHGLFVGTVRLPFSVREAPKTGRCVAGWRLLAADA